MNLWVGTDPNQPITKLSSSSTYNTEHRVNPANHFYVIKDPQNSNTILLYFDSTPTLSIDNVFRKCRLRFYLN